MSYLIIFVGLSKMGFKISITSDSQHYSQEALFIVSDGYFWGVYTKGMG